MAKEYFEGWYYKQQNDNYTIAFIPGRSSDNAFIQIITDQKSAVIPFSLDQFSQASGVTIGENSFSYEGIKIKVDSPEIKVEGELRFSNMVTFHGDIMGPFRFLPMECRHSIFSLHHQVEGELLVDGEKISFKQGRGYIEGDRGRSFPEEYSWIHANDFDDTCSVVASAAKIPFGLATFWGCLAVVYYQGKEYRLATYKGARIISRTKDQLIIRQGKWKLQVDVPSFQGHPLAAPDNGKMRRIIHESPACKAKLCFSIENQTLFDLWSHLASYEYV